MEGPNMYSYIRETPEVLTHIMNERRRIAAAFVERMKNERIDQICVLGSGTSYHAGLSAKAFLEELLGRRVLCMYPTQFARRETVFDPHTLVIGMSQGGQSLSTAEGLESARSRGFLTAGVSANPNAHIFSAADVSVLIEVGNEKCGAKTKGYAGTALTLMVMLAELALAKGLRTEAELEPYYGRMRRVIANLPVITDAAAAWYRRIEEDFLPAKRIIVIGYDGVYADVLEGALKVLETVRQGVTGYDIEEFFHGIYNSVSESAYLFYLAPAGDYKARTQKLIGILREWTPHNYLISSPEGLEASSDFDLTAPFTDDPLFCCWEYIIPMQVVACFAPQRLGINPDIPKDPDFHRRIGSKDMTGVTNPYGVEDEEAPAGSRAAIPAETTEES